MYYSPTVILNNGVEMPIIGLGAYDMYGTQAEHAIVNAIEAGYRLIDTAAMYGNEKEVGIAVKNCGIPRKEIFITTKVNDPDQGFDKTMKAFEVSLKKLDMDYVDMYLIHWPLKGKRKETWKALERIYAEKKAQAIGVANYLVPFLEELKTYSEITPAANQVEFTPYVFSKNLLDYCSKEQIQLQAYSPIARGHKNSDPKLLRLSEKYKRSPAQVMLRWCVQHHVAPIPKSVNVNRLKENIHIFDFEINRDDMDLLDTFNEDYRVAPDPIYML
ncbi:MAG TPA: aldo/keto reductase [Puia sp.]|nr:aldo/keto reductase [Puia sp.]